MLKAFTDQMPGPDWFSGILMQIGKHALQPEDAYHRSCRKNAETRVDHVRAMGTSCFLTPWDVRIKGEPKRKVFRHCKH